MFCSKCGTKAVDGAMFCGSCGNRLVQPSLADPVPAAPVQQTPVYEPPVTPVYEPPVAPAYEPPVDAAPAAPVFDTPAAPVFDTPAAPVYEPPVAPAEPAAPVYEPPVTPSYEPPVTAAYEPPVAPVAEPSVSRDFIPPAYTAPVNPTPAYEPPAAPVYTPPTPAYEPPSYNAPAPKKRKKKSMGWLWIVLALLVVGAVAAGFLTDWFGLTGPLVTIAKATEKTITAENFTVEVVTEEVAATAQVAIDVKNREITVLATAEGEEEIIAIYDGYAINGSDGEYYAEDISETLDQIFDAYEEAEKEKFTDEDIVDLLDQLGVLDYFDEDGVANALKSYVKKLNSTSWLKKNAGLTTKGAFGNVTYTFKPDLQKFVLASLEELEDAFEDEDMYDEMMEGIEDADTEDMPEVKISITVKSGKLASIIVDVDETWVEVYFSNIGSTSIDYDFLDQILDEAEQW